MLWQVDPWSGSSRRQPSTPRHRAMALDAYRRGDDVWVQADLPGVAPDSVDVSVERNVLSITAERHYPNQEGDRVYVSERAQGRYRRDLHLGDGLDFDSIEAEFVDGVLTLRIPVAERARPRKVPISTRSEAIDVSSTEVSGSSD